ncbi:MAG: hypothetical protein HOI66_09305 [Verrucomicrobia bacterium]|jgi:hypothetical protein|nr:hypothetical protein [Verrucomicrobiota bacterium]MDA7645708.1 hypothetical protein [bacterium]
MTTNKCHLTGIIMLISLSIYGCSDGPPDNDSFSSETPTATDSNILQYHWNPNVKLKYRFELSQEVEVKTIEKMIISYIRITQAYELAPIPKPKSNELAIGLTFTDQQVSLREGKSEDTYDSTKSDEHESGNFLENSFGRLVGQQIVLILAPDQEIDRFEGLAPLLTQMTQEVPLNLKNIILSIFDEDRIKQLVYLTRLPIGHINQGQAWPIQETRQFGLLGQTKLDGTARLLGTEIRDGHTLYQIQISGEVRNSSSPNLTPAQPYILSSGTFLGTARFDWDLGQYAESILTIDLDVDFNSALTRHESQPGDIHVTQKYATKLLEVETLEGGTP